MLEDLENLESLEFYFLSFLKILRILILYKDNINNISLTQHWWAIGKEIEKWRSSRGSLLCYRDMSLIGPRSATINPSRTRYEPVIGSGLITEVQQPAKAHRCPRDVLWCSRKLQGIGYTKKTAEAVFFVSSRKGFMRLCRLFQSFNIETSA